MSVSISITVAASLHLNTAKHLLVADLVVGIG